MGIDHGGSDVGMPEEFLNGPNVIMGFKKAGGKGISQGMAADPLVYPCIRSRILDCLLDNVLMKVVPPCLAAPRINPENNGIPACAGMTAGNNTSLDGRARSGASADGRCFRQGEDCFISGGHENPSRLCAFLDHPAQRRLLTRKEMGQTA
jgi:hypothetical protein